MQRFALIGAAGYIAPRHIQAIHDTNNVLVAACDPHDSVGILDKYSYDVEYFPETERFERHLDKLRRQHIGVDYVSICSPNYLHDSHIRLALRSGAHAICEKPLVVNPWNLDYLAEHEQETGKKIYTVLQLRSHPNLIKFKERLSGRHRVSLVYNTPRGHWYQHSWKGDNNKSGGLVTNIGIHLFDMLLWMFGPVSDVKLCSRSSTGIKGMLIMERADVEWDLSVLPGSAVRSMTCDGEVVDFNSGFADLHTEVYRKILSGDGDGIMEARPSIDLIHRIRNL